MRQHFTPQGIKLNIGSFGGRRIGFADPRRGACLFSGRRALRRAIGRENPFWVNAGLRASLFLRSPVLVGRQKGKCLGVAQYCVGYKNREYYCGNRRLAEKAREEVRRRKNREEEHRERVLREGFSQIAAQQRMEGTQSPAARAV